METNQKEINPIFLSLATFRGLGLRAPSALCGAAHVARAAAPGVRDAPHDISPRLERQLVPELECWKLRGEGVDVFPGRRRRGLVLPLDEHLAHAAGDAELDSTLWFRGDRAMEQRRQWWPVARHGTS